MKFDFQFFNLSVRFSVYIFCPLVFMSAYLKLQKIQAIKTIYTREMEPSINVSSWVIVKSAFEQPSLAG